MKAKIIETGEVVDVHPVLYDPAAGGQVFYMESVLSNPRSWDRYELKIYEKPLAIIDWEQRRYELVKQMLPQAAAFAKEALLSGYSIENAEGKTVMQMVAEVSINYADAVIEKLKEK